MSLALKLIDAVLADGGGTFHWATESIPTYGYQVAEKNKTLIMNRDDFDERIGYVYVRLNEYINSICEDDETVRYMGSTCHLGAWTHDGEVFIEPSFLYESLTHALKIAALNDQIVIWDNANGVEIKCP